MRKILFFIATMLFVLVVAMTGCKKNDGYTHQAGQPIKVDSFTPSAGSGATEVLISGANFSTNIQDISVTINGHSLKVISANGSQIMAVVPKKAGTGPIVVSIAGGNGQSLDTFNYMYTRTVTTLAGNGTAGYANGQGTDAQFHFTDASNSWYRSQGIVVDDNLNVYVADVGNRCIRKIDSLGNVSLLAGNPNSAGYADGKGSAAQFNLPYDLAIDPAGNLYAVDPANWDIREISPDGTATTIGWASYEPWAVAYDKSSQKVYYGSCSGGSIYSLSGDGSSTTIISGLSYPAGMKFDASGNLYVSGNGDQVIHRFSAGNWNAGVIAGSPGVIGYQNGAGTNALFSYPWGLGIDTDGNLYIAGNGTVSGSTSNADQAIRMISTGTWVVSAFAGSGTAGYTDGIGTAAAFSAPGGVTVDKNGTVYVLDKNNNRIRKIVSE